MSDPHLNGVAERASIVGWVIALYPGRTVIGKPRGAGGVSAPQILSPVFDFNGGVAVQRDQRGQPQGLATEILVFPLMGLSVDSLEIPTGTPCIAVDLLHEKERTAIGVQVERATAMLTSLRTALSGLVVPAAGLRLPPLAKGSL